MHIKNVPRSEVKQLINHDIRAHENYSNENVNLAYSNENYDLSPDRGMSKEEYLNKRLEEFTVSPQKKTAVLQSIIVTMPREIPFEDTDKIMKATYDFFCDFYGGEDNIISGTVHKDEYERGPDGILPAGPDSGMPHIHIKGIPVVNGRVSARGKTPKQVLTKLHKDLTKYVSEQVGYDVPLLNGATIGGNKSVAELKAERANERAEKAEQYVAQLESEIIGKNNEIAELKAEVQALTTESSELKKADPKMNKTFEEKKTFFSRQTYYKVSPENAKKLKKTIKDNNAEIKRLQGQAVRAEKVGDLTERVANLENTIEIQDQNIKALMEQNKDLSAENACLRLPTVRAEMEEISTECKNLLYTINGVAVSHGVDVSKDLDRGFEASTGLYDLTRAETPDTMKNAEKRLSDYADSCEVEINRFRSALNRINESVPVETAHEMSRLCKAKAKELISAVKSLFGLKEDGIEVFPERVVRQKTRKRGKDNNIGL